MTYSVYIDFEHRKIKADNPIDAKNKAVKMIEQNKAQLIRVVENESETMEHEVLNGYISYQWEEKK